MKGLAAYFDKGVADIKVEPGSAPPPSCFQGEWVIPDFLEQTKFLGSRSFETCYIGQVLPNCDPDMMMKAYTERYSGIPPRLISEFITRTCLAASELPVGSLVSLMHEGESLRLWLTEISKHGPMLLPEFKPEKYL